MPATLLGRCPGCKRDVRLPEEWATKTVRCKRCGLVSQARPNPAAAAKRTPAAAPVPVQVPAPVAQDPVAPPFVAPQPVFAAAPAGDDPFAFHAAPAGPVAAPALGKYRRKRRSWVPVVVAMFFLAVCVGGAVAGVFILGPKIRAKLREQDTASASAAAATGPTTSGSAVPTGKEEYPRRLLGISVNNYLYANPVSYGTDPSKRLLRDFGSVLARFGDKLKIPKTQIYQLSDGTPTDAKPPLKPIIEKTIVSFLSTSREQDRIILIFVGHVKEVEDKPYLVPLEGDLDDAKTLIPLESVMKQLGECKAQQKVFVADLCRYDPSRGLERPNGGKLGEKTEAMLKNPPAGVQVVSACSRGQYSYEFDDYGRAPDGYEIKGGVFLSMCLKAFRDGVGGGIPRLGDPLPIDAVASAAAKSTSEMFPAAKAETDDAGGQSPFHAGAPREEQVAYNAAEAPAAAVEIPTPEKVFEKGLTSKKELADLLDEITVPPLRQDRGTENALRFEAVVPFSAAVMQPYRADRTKQEVLKDPDKYPLRVAVIKAVEKLRTLDANKADLPEEMRSQASDAFKASLKNLQRGPARIMLDLKETIEALEKVSEDRKEEKSKRWQAHYDYALAQAKARLAYVHEYSLMAGKIRLDALPELDKAKGHTGWRLASSEKMQSNNEIKEQMNDARKLMRKLIKEHPGTPWEVLAKRERYTALGLEWVPTNFGAENATTMK